MLKPSHCHIVQHACFSGGAEQYLIQRVNTMCEYSHILLYLGQHEYEFCKHFDNAYKIDSADYLDFMSSVPAQNNIACSFTYNISEHIDKAIAIANDLSGPSIYSLHDYSVISIGPGYNRITLRKNPFPNDRKWYFPVERDANNRRFKFCSRQKLLKRLNKLAHFDALETPSTCLKNDLKEVIPEKRVFANSPYAFSSQKQSSAPENTNILFIGGLFRGKGVELLIKTLALLNTKFSLTVIGDGYLKKRFQKARFPNLTQSQFIAPLPQNRLSGYYKKAAVVVVPSVIESFGMVALEAMAHSRAVVAFNHSGLAEVVESRRFGLLAAPFNIQELAEKLELILVNYHQRAQIESAAYRRATETYSRENNVKQLTSMLADLCIVK